MKAVSLSGSLRENVGKKDAKLQRNLGRIPSVLYGGEEQKHFSVDAKAIKKVVWSPDVFVYDLDINGKKHKAVIQDIQFHPVTDEVLHLDFIEIFDEKPFSVTLPVKTEGVSPGVQKGGKLLMFRRKLRVNGLLQDMPEFISVNISKLNVAASIKVGELQSDKLTYLDPKSEVIVAVRTSRTAAIADLEDDEEDEAESESEAAE